MSEAHIQCTERCLALETERDALSYQLQLYRAERGSKDTQLDLENAALREQVAELRKDATRYRWLRDCGNPFDILVFDRERRPYYDSRLDAAVDALINRPDTAKETP